MTPKPVVKETVLVLTWRGARGQNRRQVRIAGLPHGLKVHVFVKVQTEEQFDIPLDLVIEGVPKAFFEGVEAEIRGNSP